MEGHLLALRDVFISLLGLGSVALDAKVDLGSVDAYVPNLIVRQAVVVKLDPDGVI